MFGCAVPGKKERVGLENKKRGQAAAQNETLLLARHCRAEKSISFMFPSGDELRAGDESRSGLGPRALYEMRAGG